MKQSTSKYPSSKGMVFYRRWEPDKVAEIKGVIQVAHGVMEHSGLYNYFAEYFTNKGFIIFAQDHKGHGHTIDSESELGKIDNNGWQFMLEDISLLTIQIKEEFPDLPLFLYGHSTGSFLAQHYARAYGEEINGMILSGTTLKPKWLMWFSIIVSWLSGLLFGKNSKTKLIHYLVFGRLNVQFEDSKTKFDWLSKDEKEAQAFKDDPLCGRYITNNFFLEMFKGMSYLGDEEQIQKMPKNLPILFITGTKDPVGENTISVKKLVALFKKLGLKNITEKYYKDARHALHYETNREEIFNDINIWLEKQVNAANNKLLQQSLF